MISIKMYQDKWQIIIGDEVWQFEGLAELENNLHTLLSMKNEYGRIK